MVINYGRECNTRILHEFSSRYTFNIAMIWSKTRRQIAEIVHMSFKDIVTIIIGYTGEDKQVNKLEKSKDSRKGNSK